MTVVVVVVVVEVEVVVVVVHGWNTNECECCLMPYVVLKQQTLSRMATCQGRTHCTDIDEETQSD